MRKSIHQLFEEVTANFPDNEEEFITPLRVRSFFNDLLDSLKFAHAYLYTGSPMAINIGTMPVVLDFDLSFTTDETEFIGDAEEGQIVRLVDGMTRVAFRATVQAPANREITFVLCKDGEATVWKATASGLGPNRFANISFIGFEKDGGAFSIQIEADATTTEVTVSDVHFIAEAVSL